MSKEKEFRTLGEVRLKSDEGQSRRVSGYAAVYSRFSEDFGEWREIIDPGAFDGVAEQSDIMALLNHDSRRGVLARSRQGTGSLTVRADETGLYYEFDAPHTALGDELLESLRRGDISQSSFAFTVSEERWEKNEDKTFTRHICKVDRLFDVSPVYTPAYPDTSVANRSLDDFKASTAKEDAPQTDTTPKAEPVSAPSADYYSDLRKRI